MYGIDNWINKRYGWVIESIHAEYVYISVFSQLSESTYIELSRRFRNSMKGFINIWNNNNKNMVNGLDYEGIEFRVTKKDFNKI